MLHYSDIIGYKMAELRRWHHPRPRHYARGARRSGPTPVDAPRDLPLPRLSPLLARHSQLSSIALAWCMTPRSERTYLLTISLYT